MLDHRAAPGIPEQMTQSMGLPAVREGTLVEIATLSCAHCRGAVVKNPLRVRPRNYCHKCGGEYICDGCHAATAFPGYVHRSFAQIADMVRSGKYAIGGGSAHSPVLTPITT